VGAVLRDDRLPRGQGHQRRRSRVLPGPRRRGVLHAPEALRSYLRWQLVRASAQILSKPFSDEAFAFYGQKLAGQKEQKARWKRCTDATDGALGELLGQAFVDRKFPATARRSRWT